MRRKVFIVGLLALVGAAILSTNVLFRTKKGAREIFAELHDSTIGSVYIMGSYWGLLNGWDVSLLHRDNHGNWFEYYLAHESYGWRRAKLRLNGHLLAVTKGNTLVAQYNVQNGLLSHKLQNVVYSKEDASIDQRRAAFWNLTGIQRPEWSNGTNLPR